MDHDQRFKVLLREFPEDFFRLFFPRVARQFDFARLEWLETELFPDPPEGERRAADLVAKLPLVVPRGRPRAGTRASQLLALIHIEVDASRSPADFGRRMLWYYMSLRQRHNLPVLPVAVFLKSRKAGLGREKHIERCGAVEVVRSEYLSVGLPGLESLQYLRKRNRLAPALAALMDIPRTKRVEVKLEAYERIVRGGTSRFQQFLLLNCVEAYLKLGPAEAARFNKALQGRTETKAMVQTVFEKAMEERVRKGREEGRQEGREEGRRETLLLLVEEKFGGIPDSFRRRIEQSPPEEIEALLRRAVRASSLDEVTA